MRVEEVMKRQVVTIAPDETLEKASELMKSNGIRSLVVINEARGVIGIITDSDLVLRGMAKGDFREVKVKDVMSANPVVVNYDDDLFYVVNRMRQGKFRRLPVVKQGELIGIVSITDIAPFMVDYVKKLTSY